ncbi:MAG TPA: hypothetical protein VNH20_01215 [Candidatus Dormibacteraeota bacterium]|nr:hypothetical protein [Candidatus Dormibacteraeota bacterium]
MAAVAAAISISYGVNRQRRGAALLGGIALNGLVIVAAGVAAWSRGERGTPLKFVFSPTHREALTRDHPLLMADRLILGAAILGPFVLVLCAGGELARRRAPIA